MKTLPRDTFDGGESTDSNGQEFHSIKTYQISTNLVMPKDDYEVDLVRKNVMDDIIKKPSFELHVQQKKNESDNDTIFESENESIDNSIFEDST